MLSVDVHVGISERVDIPVWENVFGGENARMRMNTQKARDASRVDMAGESWQETRVKILKVYGLEN